MEMSKVCKSRSTGNMLPSTVYGTYTVLNTGSEAISAAEIWIEVSDGERVVESAEITVQFLPLRGKQDGVFVTTRDPKIYPPQSRVESLQFP
jgi:uncharacterized protein (TIGR02588 family)